MRKEFEDELSNKEEKHDVEVNQLKADMLVAIQVARSGSSSPVPSQQETMDSRMVTETITRAGMKLSLEVGDPSDLYIEPMPTWRHGARLLSVLFWPLTTIILSWLF